MPEQMLLQASHLTVSYQGTTIVRDVSFCLAAGQVLGIAGESGCGKTTLLRALMGLSRPGGHIEGHVFLAETDLLSLTGEQLRNLRGKEIAMIPQNALSSLDQTMTISALFRQSLRVHGTVCSKQESDARAMQWLQRLHFVHSERILQSYPFELSGGMGQRVVMALALLHGPKLLLAVVVHVRQAVEVVRAVPDVPVVTDEQEINGADGSLVEDFVPLLISPEGVHLIVHIFDTALDVLELERHVPNHGDIQAQGVAGVEILEGVGYRVADFPDCLHRRVDFIQAPVPNLPEAVLQRLADRGAFQPLV